MTNVQMGVQMLAPLRQEHATRVQSRAVALQFGIQLVADQAATELQRMHRGGRIGIQTQTVASYQGGAGRRVLQCNPVKPGALAQHDITDLGAQVAVLFHAQVVFDQAQRGTFAELDDSAHVPGQIGPA